MRLTARYVLAIALLCGSSQVAFGQAEAPVGVRATGMGGAFTAVADDASAVYWNPAGLASGSYFSLIVDRNALGTSDDADATHGRTGLLVAVGTPPLGLSYYRTRVTRTQPIDSTEANAAGRNTVQGGEVRLETLVTDQAGVTLLQSIGRGFAIGGTLKYVWGTAGSGITTETGKPALEEAEHLPAMTKGTFDADLGIMAVGSLGRVGLSVRNLMEPSFDTTETPAGTASIVLQRRIRGGLALKMGEGVLLAADADFTTADASFGRWRDAAVGGEAKIARGAWVRSGVHWNTAGDSGVGAAPILSIGGSYAVKGSVLADVQASVGSRNGDQGWGVGVRFVF